MKISRLLSIVTPVAIILFVATSCTGGFDFRYQGWAGYTDKQDGYRVFVPEGWEARNEMANNMRGTRFSKEEGYQGDQAIFLYYLIMVKDVSDTSGEAQSRFESYIPALTDNIWKEISYVESPAEIDGIPAVRFRFTGKPYFSSYSLRGRLVVFEHDGKDFMLFGCTTEKMAEDMNRKYDLIEESFTFDLKPQGQ